MRSVDPFAGPRNIRAELGFPAESPCDSHASGNEEDERSRRYPMRNHLVSRRVSTVLRLLAALGLMRIDMMGLMWWVHAIFIVAIAGVRSSRSQECEVEERGDSDQCAKRADPIWHVWSLIGFCRGRPIIDCDKEAISSGCRLAI
jgi:hypothetical protein